MSITIYSHYYLFWPQYKLLIMKSILKITIYVLKLLQKNVCVLQGQPTAILRASGSAARRIDGVECGLFSTHAPLGQTTLRVGRVSV